MQRDLRITRDPIDETALTRTGAESRSRTAGAALVFVGIVRDREGDAPIRALDYEAFEAMATHQFHRLFDQMAGRWPMLESVRLVHRIGPVEVGEPSLWVEVVSPHRGEAFAAAQWLIDEMKRVVPIWKRPIPVNAANAA